MKNMFKIASLLAVAVMLFACQKVETEDGLVITADRDVLQSDGKDYVTLKVLFRGKDVTAESLFYDESDAPLALEGGKFSATEDGEYKFWATYGTYSTVDPNDVDGSLFVVKAISVEVPAAAADPQKNSTSFVHRAFLTQYTGTGCGYCPAMIKIVRELVADKTIPEKAVHTAVHSFNSADPAYISAPKVNNYPYLTVDQVTGFSHSQTAGELKSLVESSVASAAKAGISVNPVYYEEEKLLIVTVSVKASLEGLYNVGAWLLEDDIYGMQEDYNNIGDKSYSTHENCVRIADSKYKGTWFGHSLGTIKSGDVATKVFVMNVKKAWKVENLHLAVFTSYGEKDGDKLVYTVCNAVDAPIDAPTPFEYK